MINFNVLVTQGEGGGGIWVNIYWVCTAGLSEPLPHCSRSLLSHFLFLWIEPFFRLNEEHFTFHLRHKHSGTFDVWPAQRSNHLKGPRLDYNFKMPTTATTTTTTTIIIIIIIIILSGFVCIFVSSLKSSSLITKVETRPTSNAKSISP